MGKIEVRIGIDRASPTERRLEAVREGGPSECVVAFDVETRVIYTLRGVYSNASLLITEIATRRTFLLTILFAERCEYGYVPA